MVSGCVWFFAPGQGREKPTTESIAGASTTCPRRGDSTTMAAHVVLHLHGMGLGGFFCASAAYSPSLATPTGSGLCVRICFPFWGGGGGSQRALTEPTPIGPFCVHRGPRKSVSHFGGNCAIVQALYQHAADGLSCAGLVLSGGAGVNARQTQGIHKNNCRDADPFHNTPHVPGLCTTQPTLTAVSH